MALPPVTYGEWLQKETLFSEAVNTAIAAAWGDDAVSSETMTALATVAAANAEAVRQALFFGLSLVIDAHDMVGQFTQYIGKTITIVGNRLGYDAGVNVLVLGAVDDRAINASKVVVLRAI